MKSYGSLSSRSSKLSQIILFWKQGKDEQKKHRTVSPFRRNALWASLSRIGDGSWGK